MRTNMWLKRKCLILSSSVLCFLIVALSILGPRTSLASTNKTNSKMVSEPARAWTSTKTLFTGRHEHTATLLSDGRVLVVGGLRERSPGSPGLASAEIFDPISRKWSSTGSLNEGRCFHRATLLENGQVLVTGGRDRKMGTGLASVEIYDPVSGTWDFAPPMSVPRFSHSATLLPDGRVLVAGGRFSSNNPDVHASAELYDPQAKTWSPTGSLLTPREAHSATLIPDSRVLVVGGYYTNSLNTSEVYDLVSGTWYENADPLFCHGVAHTATRLYDDRVLVVGGACITGILSEAEIFDPITSSWKETPSLPTAREVHTATLLPDGTVLIIGGDDGDVPRYDSALIYDPANDTWRTTSPLNVGRRNHTATLLHDGSVLIVGGWSDTTTALDITELYLDSIIDSPTTGDTLIPPANVPSPTNTPTSTSTQTAEPFFRRVLSYPWISAFLVVSCLIALLCITIFVWWLRKFTKLKKKDVSF
jgi:hypothetical protein